MFLCQITIRSERAVVNHVPSGTQIFLQQEKKTLPIRNGMTEAKM